MSARTRRWAWAGAALSMAILPLAAHAWIRFAIRIVPPQVHLPQPGAARAWTRLHGGLREVHLQGTPEEIGASQTRLLHERMVADEARLWTDYEHYVPWKMARMGLEDLARLRYRHLDQSIPEARRRELAAQSLAFQPDPFTSRMPTYQRMVFLHALYDIALSFEHSPLIGCSSFALGSTMNQDGHVLVARSFDMETDEVLDLDKAMFLVREDGAIPFASVAWPGFVGVVTGMNSEGVFVVVHGARAREPRVEGVPVAFSLREVLERAHDTSEAISILRSQEVMVSHIVFAADPLGHFAVIERAPGAPAYVRTLADTAVVTNDFQGPLAADPKNVQVRSTTTSLARADRIKALVSRLAPHTGSPRAALGILRDHECAADDHCELGDRRSVDALIATHGVVADLSDRVIWVGVGPHLSGAFVRFDLSELLAQSSEPSIEPEHGSLPEDPILRDGRYARAQRRGAGRAP